MSVATHRIDQRVICMRDRYETGELGAFEPGSDDRVLGNMLGITRTADMNEAELVLLAKLYDEVLTEAFPDRQLTVADIKAWHYRWLGNVYRWAGDERAV